MIRGFKYKIKPTVKQQNVLSQTFGCCRFIYNWGLDMKTTSYSQNKQKVSYNDLAKQLTLLKKQEEYKWLNDVANESLQQSLRCLENAFTRFFREKKGYPKRKTKRKSKDVAKFINSVRFDFDKWKVKIPRVGWVKLCHNKEIDLSVWTLGTLTVERDKCGDYWVTVICKNDVPYPTKAKLEKNKALGIDLGIKDYAILSNGEKINNPKHLEASLKTLAHQQKVFARKTKGSKRREKQRLKVARLHRHVANQRNNFIQQVTTRLVNMENVNTFVMEDLNVEGMMKNHKLAKSIQSVSWNEFVRVLTYKCENTGKNLLHIGRFEPSTKMCHVCGYINNDITLNVREWTCPECGTHHDRDVNAAINILNIAFDKQNLIGTSAHERQKHPPVSGKEDVEGRGYEPGETLI